MDCGDVQKFIHTYLDGELVEDERVSVAAHLEACSSCGQLARFEQRFKERIMACSEPVVAPARSRARLSTSLDQIDAQLAEETAQREHRRRWIWRLAPVMAAACAVAAFLVLPEDSSDRVAEQTVSWHRARLPMDVTGSQEERIRTFFRDKVPFAVKLPRFANAERVKLVGARLTNLQGQRAVALTYRVDGQRVSVFLVDPQAIRAQQPRRPVRWRGVRGYNVGTYVSEGTGYAITSEMDRRNLVRLISSP